MVMNNYRVFSHCQLVFFLSPSPGMTAFPKSDGKKCNDSPFYYNFHTCLSVIGEKVYGKDFDDNLVMYNPAQDKWYQLSKVPGNIEYATWTAVSNEIQTWDSNSQKWRKPYPPMSQGR